AYENAPFTGPFDAKLSVGSPRRDSLSPLLTLSGLRLTGDWTPGRWLGRLPTTGLRTAWLETVEGSLSLASKGGIVGDGLRLEAELSDGLLHIDQIEASPWQGELQAEVKLERRNDQPFVTIVADLDQVEAADFADWIGLKSGIDGPLDLRLEARSSGPTPYNLMAGLAGELAIKAGPGVLKGRGIPLLRETLAAETSDRITANSRLAMPYREIDAEARLSRGVLTFEDARLLLNPVDGTDTEAAVDGTVDMLLWVIDLALTATGTADPAPSTYRLVGPPDRPAGWTAAGN
ncbi:MAG: AsmA-like C-terminal region-containing protein, partial [Geminicoccaceae bacterium]